MAVHPPFPAAAAFVPPDEADVPADTETLLALHDRIARLLSVRTLADAMQEILRAAIEMQGTRLGNVQILNPATRKLEIVAQQGFEAPFLDHFREVSIDDDCACGRALRSGKRHVIEDIETDPECGPGFRRVAAEAGYRAVQSTPLIGRDGTPLGMLSTHYPRPHKLSERETRALDLYARQAADIVERLRREEALEDEGRRKDEFIAVLSHELRNPLAPIVNGLHILRADRGDAASRERILAMMERSVRQLVRMVDDLLDASRIAQGKFALEKAPADLARVVREAVDAAMPAIAAAEHAVVVDVPEAPVTIECDTPRIAQVLANLLQNAAKYTPPGGRIMVRLERAETTARIAIADTGIGIPAEILPKLFAMFVQARHRHGDGGLGIGLALAKQLVELHGGSIVAKSAGSGAGAEFIVELPAGG